MGKGTTMLDPGSVPGEVREIPGVLNAKMVWIPAGEFLMGSPDGDPDAYGDEKPQRLVETPNGFWMWQTPVTQEQFEAVMGYNPSHFKGDHKRPVEMVDWHTTAAFCKKIGWRLPTEAEWEYACRAGSQQSRYGALDAIAWYWDNAGQVTHTVGQMEPNAWGLYDMLGNVWERCATDGSQRVCRGGSWNNVAWRIRAASRDGLIAADRYGIVGFRPVRSAG